MEHQAADSAATGMVMATPDPPIDPSAVHAASAAPSTSAEALTPADTIATVVPSSAQDSSGADARPALVRERGRWICTQCGRQLAGDSTRSMPSGEGRKCKPQCKKRKGVAEKIQTSPEPAALSKQRRTKSEPGQPILLASTTPHTHTNHHFLRNNKMSQLVRSDGRKVPAHLFDASKGQGGPSKEDLLAALKQWLATNPHNNRTVVEQLLDDKHHRIIYTPPFCPECQPIELLWATVKRQVAAQSRVGRTLQQTREQVEEAFEGITPAFCRKLINHCHAWINGFLQSDAAGDLQQQTPSLDLVITHHQLLLPAFLTPAAATNASASSSSSSSSSSAASSSSSTSSASSSSSSASSSSRSLRRRP